MNIATLITIGIIITLLIFAVTYMVEANKKKKSVCFGNCSGCVVRCEDIKNDDQNRRKFLKRK